MCDKRLQVIIDDWDQCSVDYGMELTKQLKKRIDQLRAHVNFGEFLEKGLGKPHRLQGSDYDRCYAVSVGAAQRLILRPVVDDLSPESLKMCQQVEIKGVQEYHGQKTTYLIP